MTARTLVIALLLTVTAPLRGAIDEARFRADLAKLTAAPTRVPGSTGYDDALAYLEAEISRLGNAIDLRRHEFPLIVPVTRHASLTLPDGSTEPVFPFYPASARVNSTPTDGIVRRLVFCGTATNAEIPPESLADQIAVIEASAGERWRRVAEFGARAILVLGFARHVARGPAQPRRGDPRQHPAVLRSTGAAVRPASRRHDRRQRDAARDRDVRTAHGGEPVRARAPRATGALRATEPWPSPSRSIRVASCPTSLPARARPCKPRRPWRCCATSAQNPPARPVMIAFTGGDGVNFAGSRNMLLALAESPARWDEELSEISYLQSAAEADLGRATEAGDAPQRLDASRDRALLARVTTILESDAVAEQAASSASARSRTSLRRSRPSRASWSCARRSSIACVTSSCEARPSWRATRWRRNTSRARASTCRN
jgi:hypothetical protein